MVSDKHANEVSIKFLSKTIGKYKVTLVWSSNVDQRLLKLESRHQTREGKKLNQSNCTAFGLKKKKIVKQ